MNDFKILLVDTERKTMIVDWGYITLNHDIPLYILENPDIPKEVMLEHVGYMRPPVPVEYEVPPTLLELVDNELETYIVPIKGSVEVNGKTIEEFKSGRLLIGKEANLSVPEGTICAIVKVVRENQPNL